MAPPRPQGPQISWPALGAIISMVVGSLLLGAGIQPLLDKSSSEDWMGPEVLERRAETQSMLAAEVERLQDSTTKR